MIKQCDSLNLLKLEIMDKSEKSFVSTLLLCLLLGFLGAHRFYAGKIVSGVFMLLTFGGFGIWSFIDLIIIACGNFRDKEGLLIKN